MADVINLCFHGVGTPARSVEPGESAYWVTRDTYLGVLDLIAERPDVRVSFDDGNASDVELALPGLVERGLGGDFFVLAGRIDHGGSVDGGGIRALVENGMTIGSHGMHHRSWRHLSEADRREELVEARRILTELAGTPVDTAALPFGDYDRRALAGLRRTGYRAVFTSDRRRSAADDWLQHRYSVRDVDTVASIRDSVLTAPTLRERLQAGVKGLAKRWR